MSNQILEGLNIVKNARDNIKIKLEEKQSETVTDDITTYANLIDNIQTGSGDIKLFETIEEMQNDPDPKVDGLAVVYRSEITSCTPTSEFNKMIFPLKITVEEAVTDYIDINFRAVDESSGYFDCWGEISQSMFRVDCWGESDGSYTNIRVQYVSEDGLVYTRTRFEDQDGELSGEEVILDQVVKYGGSEEYWNNRIGDFIKIGGNIFEGLFKYSDTTDKDLLAIKKDKITWEADPDNWELKVFFPEEESEVVTIDTIEELVENIPEGMVNPSYWGANVFLSLDKTKLYLYCQEQNNIINGRLGVILTDNTIYLGRGKNDNYDLARITYDIENKTYEKVTLEKTIINNKDCCESPEGYWVGSIWADPAYNNNTDTSFQYVYEGNEYWYYYTNKFYHYNKYNLTSNQFTLSSKNQLLPGISAYGGTGIVEGDGSIYDIISALDFIRYNEEDICLDYFNYEDKTKPFLSKEETGVPVLIPDFSSPIPDYYNSESNYYHVKQKIGDYYVVGTTVSVSSSSTTKKYLIFDKDNNQIDTINIRSTQDNTMIYWYKNKIIFLSTNMFYNRPEYGIFISSYDPNTKEILSNLQILDYSYTLIDSRTAFMKCTIPPINGIVTFPFPYVNNSNNNIYFAKVKVNLDSLEISIDKSNTTYITPPTSEGRVYGNLYRVNYVPFGNEIYSLVHIPENKEMLIGMVDRNTDTLLTLKGTDVGSTSTSAWTNSHFIKNENDMICILCYSYSSYQYKINMVNGTIEKDTLPNQNHFRSYYIKDGLYYVIPINSSESCGDQYSKIANKSKTISSTNFSNGDINYAYFSERNILHDDTNKISYPCKVINYNAYSKASINDFAVYLGNSNDYHRKYLFNFKNT